MRIESKAQLSKVTLILLILITCFFTMGIILGVVAITFHLNPFREMTTTFLMMAFLGSIGLATATLFLNVATNLSLIADSKISELKLSSKQNGLRPWFIGLSGVTVIVLAFIVLGSTYSEKTSLKVTQSQVNEVLNENKDLLNQVAKLIQDGSAPKIKKVSEIIRFLRNQRAGLPYLTLIYSGSFEDRLALYEMSDSFSADEKGTFQPRYYQCTQEIDCTYLRDFFKTGNLQTMEKLVRKTNAFYIYFPFQIDGVRFVLLFTRYQNYGKIGS